MLEKQPSLIKFALFGDLKEVVGCAQRPESNHINSSVVISCVCVATPEPALGWTRYSRAHDALETGWLGQPGCCLFLWLLCKGSPGQHHTMHCPRPGEPQALELASTPSKGKALLGFKSCPKDPGYHHRGWLQERFWTKTSGRERNWVASMTTSLLSRGNHKPGGENTRWAGLIQHWLLDIFHYILLCSKQALRAAEVFSWACSSRISAPTSAQLREQLWSWKYHQSCYASVLVSGFARRKRSQEVLFP